MRKLSERSSQYELDQVSLLDWAQNMWGYAQTSQVVHFNDRLRLFGIIVTIPRNLPFFVQLVEGVGSKNVLDGKSLSPKERYQQLTFDFGNDLIKIVLSPNATDVDG